MQNKTKVMGHAFQVECWEIHLSGCYIMAKEIGKGNGKSIEKEKRH